MSSVNQSHLKSSWQLPCCLHLGTLNKFSSNFKTVSFKARSRHSFKAFCNNRPEGVRCYVNDEGHLVCERLEPGDYIVRTLPNEADKAKTGLKIKNKEIGEDKKNRVSFCYITDNGELLCESLPEGTYTLERASEEHIKDMLDYTKQLIESEKESGDTNTTTQQPVLQEDVINMKNDFQNKDEIRCYINAEGHLVCERLEPGDYVVKALNKEKLVDKEFPNKDNPAFCFITEDGELICEGLPEGEYSIGKASDEDLATVVKRVAKTDDEKN